MKREITLFANKLSRLFFYSCLVLLMMACEPQKVSKNQDLELAVDNQQALTFIVHPYDNPSRLVARFTPLCDYLGAILGQQVHLVIARSYVDQIQRISSGNADLAYMGPTPYLRSQDHYLAASTNKLTPLAAEVKAGKASYQSVIVVRNNTSILTLKDLADRTLALGAPHSFSSHYVPRVMLGNAGIGFSDLRDFAFLGRHERVALSVLHGDFDAGGLNLDVALRFQNRQPGLRIISRSPPLPPHLIVASPLLEGTTVILLRQALLDADTDSTTYQTAMQALGTDTYFIKPGNDGFERARRIIAAVESTPSVLPQW